MKITIEIPDTTVCAFFDYVFYTSAGMSMASKQICTDDIKSGEAIVCVPTLPTDKDCSSCKYYNKDRDNQPCVTCVRYSNYEAYPAEKVRR